MNGVSVTEQTARLLATPDVVVSYEDAQALLYEWLNNIGLGQHLSSFLDAGYDSPVLLAGITEAVSCGFEIVGCCVSNIARGTFSHFAENCSWG